MVRNCASLRRSSSCSWLTSDTSVHEPIQRTTAPFASKTGSQRQRCSTNAPSWRRSLTLYENACPASIARVRTGENRSQSSG